MSCFQFAFSLFIRIVPMFHIDAIKYVCVAWTASSEEQPLD